MLMVLNEEVRGFIRTRYSAADIDRLVAWLRSHGTFDFPAFPNGLYPASPVTEGSRHTGYGRVWVRDNVHIAAALHACGLVEQAYATVDALARFFRGQAGRFVAISDGESDPAEHGMRPAIRFRAETLVPDQDWPNAQNDALGYFLWLYARLARERMAAGRSIDWDVLALFPPYLRAIAYWQDEDSGHWEETPKVSASSIGTVVAGLSALLALIGDAAAQALPARHSAALGADLIDQLIAQGSDALGGILPAECVQPDPDKHRRYDAALLFLIHPLDVVDDAMADRIVEDVLEHLSGDIGVRRYPGDSFWCTDYRSKLARDQRTRDWSRDLATRNALAGPGEEAEWCLFDPVLSLIAGTRYRRTGAIADLERQTFHLNRSLGHLTAATSAIPALRCPELYHLQDGRHETSDATPLLWTQALLLRALLALRHNLDAKR